MNDGYKMAYVENQSTKTTYDLGNKKKKGPLKGILIFAGVTIAIIVIALIFKTIGHGTDSTGNSYPGDDFIAQIDVIGPIMQDSSGGGLFSGEQAYKHKWTVDTIDELMDEDSNKGILLFLDTPGGAVYETDEVYLKLLEYKEKTGRPVYGVMGHMAASGGYYMAAACDKIIANRNTWTGSIGVTLGDIFDLSALLEKHGVKVNTITSGANKAMGDRYHPMSDEQKAIFQSLVDEAYGQFTQVVAKGRHMDIERVRKLADGRIYTAKQAKANGLIDEVMDYDEAVKYMKKAEMLKEAKVVKLNDERGKLFPSFAKFNIKNFRDEVFPKSDLTVINEMTKKSNEVKPMYIY